MRLLPQVRRFTLITGQHADDAVQAKLDGVNRGSPARSMASRWPIPSPIDVSRLQKESTNETA